jgi:hypothetical protein
VLLNFFSTGRRIRWQLLGGLRRHRRMWIAARLGMVALVIALIRQPADSSQPRQLVLAAARDIEPGTTLRASDIRTVAIDKSRASLVSNDSPEGNQLLVVGLDGSERASRRILAGQILTSSDLTSGGGPVVAQLDQRHAIALPNDVIHPEVAGGDALVLHVLIDGPDGADTRSINASTIATSNDGLVVAVSPLDAPALAQALTMGQVIVAVTDSTGAP